MKKKNVYLFPLLTLLIIIGLSLLFVKPKVEDILIANDTLKIETKRLIALTEKLAFLENQDIEKLKNEVNISEIAIPSEKDVPYFLTTLDLLAKDASVSVISVNTSPGKISTESGVIVEKSSSLSPSGVGKLSLNVVVEGNFDNLKVFLTKMATSFPLQTVSSINFTRRGKGEEIFGTVAANFSVFVHYKLLPKTLGKIEEPIDKLTAEEEKLILSLFNYTKPSVSSIEFIPVGKADPFSEP